MSTEISKERRDELASLYILFEIVERDKVWNALLVDSDKLLEEYLTWLHAKKYIELDPDGNYISTDKGIKVIENFNDRDSDFIRRYDIFCAVDTDEGSFAFSEMMNLDDNEWSDYLMGDQWVDLRTVVCELHQIDPVEMMFISFIRDEILNTEEDGWQFDLCMGSIFNDMEDIINSMFTISDFAVCDDNGDIVLSGEDHIKRYLEVSNQVMKDITLKREALADHFDDGLINNSEEDDQYEEMTTTTYVVEEELNDDWFYYDEMYSDVYYVNPCWSTPIYIDVY